MSEKMPPKNMWVLVARPEYYQKPWEIMSYMGIMTNKRRRFDENGNWIEEEYVYPAWTSGHGDIMSEDPVAWMPMPEPYKED